MAKPGITFGSSGNGDSIIATLSVLDNIDQPIEDMMREFLEEAVKEMARDIKTKGVKDGVPNSDGRLKTRNMLHSVGYTLKRNARGRIAITLGYIHNTPKYALFQEYGTDGGQNNGRGILELLALTNAYANFERKVQDAFDNGRVLRFNQPGLASGYRGGRDGDYGLTD